MYQQNCPLCNGRLYLAEVHVVFSPGEVPVDAVIGTNFGMDDIYDCVMETAVCGECCAVYHLNDLYRDEGETETAWITTPVSEYLH